MSNTRKVRRARKARDEALELVKWNEEVTERFRKSMEQAKSDFRHIEQIFKDIRGVITNTLPREHLIAHLAGVGIEIRMPAGRDWLDVEICPEPMWESVVSHAVAMEPIHIRTEAMYKLIVEYDEYCMDRGICHFTVSVGGNKVAFSFNALSVIPDEHFINHVAKELVRAMKERKDGKASKH